MARRPDEGGPGLPGASYAEAPPPTALADRVACLWRVAPSATRTASILPDGCVDLVWHGGALSVAGPDTGPRIAPPHDGAAVGVRLRPGAATTFGTSAAALRDEHPSAEELWGAAGRRLTERVAEAADDRARLDLLVGAVAAGAAGAPAIDPAVTSTVARLALGRSSVRAAASAAGVGERQLRRRFLEHVGYGPKTLDRVLRLQRFLLLAITTDDDLAGLAAGAGYADQAHLGREARALAGTTPARLVADRRPEADRRPVADRRPGMTETSKTALADAGRMTA